MSHLPDTLPLYIVTVFGYEIISSTEHAALSVDRGYKAWCHLRRAFSGRPRRPDFLGAA